MTTLSPPADFHWTPQPLAQTLVHELIEDFLSKHRFTQTLSDRLRDEAGVRFADNLDFIRIPVSATSGETESGLRDAGFVGPADMMQHPGGVFPVVRIMDGPSAIGVKVECVEHFAQTHGWDTPLHGDAGSRLRWTSSSEGGAELWAVERHGWADFDSPGDSPEMINTAEAWLDKLRKRPRDGADDATLFDQLLQLINDAKADLPQDWVCDLFFKAEREYWMTRNAAARAQYDRQQKVGIGWANHDHHTYRCSRDNIHRLVAVLESLGLACRESFTPGPDAGWGAQVLEQPVTHIVVFADVDMSPEELNGDFSHEGLPPRDSLGTVGLWCGLHGDSMFSAGMHHLECMFDFAGLAEQLKEDKGIGMMAPFSDFDHLKQQFTEGEVWAVNEDRLQRLLDADLLTADQADRFKSEGALGSHLENLERNDGFKGFNQKGITHIINQTDPRIAGARQ